MSDKGKVERGYDPPKVPQPPAKPTTLPDAGYSPPRIPIPPPPNKK